MSIQLSLMSEDLDFDIYIVKNVLSGFKFIASSCVFFFVTNVHTVQRQIESLDQQVNDLVQ